MKPHVKSTGDALWELATRISEKRAQPGDSVKSILRDLRQLYRGLKRMAPKSATSTPLDQVRKFLNDKGRGTRSAKK
jgi:hypothetical protein